MIDTASPLAIQRFTCSGPYMENAYLVFPARQGGEGARPAWIVDPGAGCDELLAAVARQGLDPQAILLTHGHFDHIAGVPEVRAAFPQIPIWMPAGEADAFESPELNVSHAFGLTFSLDGVQAGRLIEDGETLALGDLTFEAICCPGHSPAGMCYHCEQSGDVLAGDVVFAGSIGRTDLPGGDTEGLVRCIRERLLTLADATRLWPGHGPATTVLAERQGNPFLQ